MAKLYKLLGLVKSAIKRKRSEWEASHLKARVMCMATGWVLAERARKREETDRESCCCCCCRTPATENASAHDSEIARF